MLGNCNRKRYWNCGGINRLLQTTNGMETRWYLGKIHSGEKDEWDAGCDQQISDIVYVVYLLAAQAYIQDRHVDFSFFQGPENTFEITEGAKNIALLAPERLSEIARL